MSRSTTGVAAGSDDGSMRPVRMPAIRFRIARDSDGEIRISGERPRTGRTAGAARRTTEGVTAGRVAAATTDLPASGCAPGAAIGARDGHVAIASATVAIAP